MPPPTGLGPPSGSSIAQPDRLGKSRGTNVADPEKTLPFLACAWYNLYTEQRRWKEMFGQDAQTASERSIVCWTSCF